LKQQQQPQQQLNFNNSQQSQITIINNINNNSNNKKHHHHQPQLSLAWTLNYNPIHCSNFQKYQARGYWKTYPKVALERCNPIFKRLKGSNPMP